MISIKRQELFAALNLCKARVLSKNMPLFVGWALTNRCNYTCKYCARWNTPSEELTTQEILYVIGELAEMGAYRINFTGGEPLMRQDLGSIVRTAKTKGIRVDISTNGSLVPQMMDIIKGIDCLRVSYDGPQEIHDRQRIEGGHSDAVEAIISAKQNNLSVSLHTVLTNINLDYAPHILEFAKGVSVLVHFAVIGSINYISESDVQKLLPDVNKYKTTLEFLIKEKKNGNKNIGNSLDGLKYLYEWPNYKDITCCAGKIYCRIEPNGDVYPCGGVVAGGSSINCKYKGFRSAFKKLKLVGCKACWCDTRIEMSKIYTFNLKVVRDLIGYII